VDACAEIGKLRTAAGRSKAVMKQVIAQLQVAGANPLWTIKAKRAELDQLPVLRQAPQPGRDMVTKVHHRERPAYVARRIEDHDARNIHRQARTLQREKRRLKRG
jgi:hypothetical protein